MRTKDGKSVRCGDAHLQFLALGGRDRRVMSSRPAWFQEGVID